MKPGDALPSLERTVRFPDMIAYAGATWDWHRLHYDADYLKRVGVPRPVVDGQMLGALIAEQVQDALGPSWFITNLAFRLKGMVFEGETIFVEGSLEDVDEGTVATRHTISAGGRPAAEGSAKARLR